MNERVGTAITDLARVAAGFVVLGAQQAQVHRRELQKQIEPHLRDAASLVDQAAGVVQQRVDPTFAQIEEQLSGATVAIVRETKTVTTEALRAVRRLAAARSTEGDIGEDHVTER